MSTNYKIRPSLEQFAFLCKQWLASEYFSITSVNEHSEARFLYRLQYFLQKSTSVRTEAFAKIIYQNEVSKFLILVTAMAHDFIKNSQILVLARILGEMEPVSSKT